MNREEQIRQASIEYTLKNRPMCVCGDSFAEMADELNRNHAFEEGVKWADNNPLQDIVNLNDVWHDASEEQLLEDKEIIFLNEQDNAYISESFGGTFSYMLEDSCWERYVNLLKISKWAYITDLLPKGGKK